MSQNLCLDDLQQEYEVPFKLGVYSCHRPNVTKSQFLSLTNSGILRTELSCASAQKNTETETETFNVLMSACQEGEKFNEKWELTDHKQIRHIDTDMCLDTENLNAQDHVFLSKCDADSETQKWKIGH